MFFFEACQDTENEILEMRVSHYKDVKNSFPGPNVFLEELSKEKVKPGTQYELDLQKTYENGVVQSYLEEDK